MGSQPAKALLKPSLLGTNGSPTAFTGFDALSSQTAGSYRTGKAPLTIMAATTAAGWTGAYPITFSFVWGDGAANVSYQNCFSCAVSPNFGGFPIPNAAIVLHTYNVAGFYNLIVNVSDSLGVFRSDTYKVQVFSVSQAFQGWRVFIEGAGLVANLTRQVNLAQPIMAYLYKNGTSPLTGGFTATWYMDTWSNVIYTKTYTQTVLPDAYFPFAWPGNTPQVISAPGTHQFWVKTSCPGCSGFGANVSSPKMTVVYTSATVAPSMTVTLLTGSVSNLQPGQTTTLQYRITNPSPFTINWFDQVSFSGSVLVAPDPPAIWSQFGPVINNTIPTYYLQPFNGAVTDQGDSPFTNLGYLLQPGQNLTIKQEINNPSISSGSFSGGFQVTFTPYVAASCTAPTALTGASCAYGGNPITAVTTVTTGGPAPASITTGYGQQIGNGSVVLVGYVNSLGANAVLQAWFTFTVPNGTTYTTQTQLETGPATVRQYLYGLPTGNYSMTMNAVTGGGTSLSGGTVTFTVGISSGANNPASNGQGAVQNFLFSMAIALNMPAVLLGLILGLFLIMGGIVLLLMAQYFFETDIPPIVWLPMLLTMAGVNIALFLWPDWLALVIFVVIGLLIWREFNASGAGGGVTG